MYLFNSLAKSSALFWKSSINRNNTFELKYYKYSLIWNVTVWYSLFLNRTFFKNSFIFNFKHQTNKWWYFFEQDWGKFEFGKNFLKRESPTLRPTFLQNFSAGCFCIILKVIKLLFPKSYFYRISLLWRPNNFLSIRFRVTHRLMYKTSSM